METMEIGGNIRALRLRKKLTQEELGKRLGVSKQAVNHWENGKFPPSARNMEKLAEFFGVDMISMKRVLVDDHQLREVYRLLDEGGKFLERELSPLEFALLGLDIYKSVLEGGIEKQDERWVRYVLENLPFGNDKGPGGKKHIPSKKESR